MGECSDGLHFDRVSLIQRVIQNTGRINNLPARIFIIRMTHEQALRSESIRLHINIGISHIINQTRFTNIRIARQNERARIGINARQPSQMLPHLLQIAKR